MTPAQDGSNNETYLVTVAGRPEWVLQVSQNLSTSQMLAEHRLLALLGRAGLPFAVPSPAGLVDGTGTVAETAGGPAAVEVSGLPVQVVHGDMGASNLLVDPDRGAVTGVLDFEIAGTTLRVDELVAGLEQSGVLSSGERWPALTAALVRGYCSACALTSAEIAAVPGLLISRAAGSVVWRAGRWQRGVSTRDEVDDRLNVRKISCPIARQ